MRAVITGGAGFLGSHLAEALLRRGQRVCILDDLSTGTRENIASLVARDDVRFVKGSVLDERIVRSLLDDADIVFHLAAAGGIRCMVDNPLRSLQVNVRGTETVLEACYRAGRRVVIASAAEVYGKNVNRPLREDDDVVLGETPAPRWGYAASKALGEFLAMAYHREKELPVIAVRFFNPVGPRQSERHGRVIPQFVRQALLGEPITIHGDGEQICYFTYVTDVVEALLALAEHPGALGEVFNVGNPEGISIDELARRVRTTTNSGSSIAHMPAEEVSADGHEDVPCRAPDISKIRRLIGYVPKVSLDEALGRVIEYTAARLSRAELAAGKRRAGC